MFGRVLIGSTVISAGISFIYTSCSKSRGINGRDNLQEPLPRIELLRKVFASRLHYLTRVKCLELPDLSERSPKMDYRTEADNIAQNTLNIFKSTDWKVAKQAKDVRVLYKKSSEFDGHIYRAECEVEAPPEKIIEYILPSPRGLRGKWDKTVKESEVIEKLDEDLIIARSATHSAAMGLISSRDFCDLIVVKRYPDENIVSTNSKSIQRKDCPPKDGYVRGTNFHGGTFCIPVEGEPNKTRIVNIVQTDLSGMLPKTVVESALPTNLIDFFRDLDTALKDNIISSG